MVALERGKGCWLYDYDGNRYLDSISSWWVNLFGHSNTRINEAIKCQLEVLEHTMLAGFTHKPAVELSERLSDLTKHQLGHVFFASDGASAIEIALKMSFHYWSNVGQKEKTEFVCLKNSYHGETLGALAVSDIALYKDIYGALLGKVNVIQGPDSRKDSDTQWSTHGCLKQLEDLFRAKAKTLSAMIIEPLVQGAAGMVMYSPDYVSGVRRLCSKYDIHFIADEIAVGFGRTGTMFACDQAKVTPDFMVLSKGISGGYLPLSVVMTKDSIYDVFYDSDITRGFLHSHTYTGNPLACVAANTVLDIFQSENVLVENKNKSRLIRESL